MSKPVALQLCPFSDYLSAAIREHFDVVNWFELSEYAQDEWLTARAGTVTAVATGGHLGCSNALIDSLSNLGVIAINGVGFDRVDLTHAKSRGIHVTNTPDVLTEDVADLAIGLIIGLLRALPSSDAFVRAGRWPEGDMPLARKVTGRRFGIVGLGRIGSAIAARLASFGPISYTDIGEKAGPYTFMSSLVALAEASDVLVLASSANSATKHLVGKDVLAALGSAGYLVNVARGSLIDEKALAVALESGIIAGAALDVFEHEPHVPDVLRTSEKTILSPHIASATVETRTAMADLVAANLSAFACGDPLPTPVI